MTRVPSVPLITSDPYFSLWSPADRLYDTEVAHWTGKAKPITGIIAIDGSKFRFMGAGAETPLPQTGLEITPTSSIYTFAGAGVEFTLRFTSPLLLTDPELVSRPCTYISMEIESADGAEHAVSVSFAFDERICHESEAREKMSDARGRDDGLEFIWMGKAKQSPLNQSGDAVTIDWGYLYLAACENTAVFGCDKNGEYQTLTADIGFGAVSSKKKKFITAAYDDTVSIMYFGQPKKAFWAEGGRTIMDALHDAVRDYNVVMKKCEVFDTDLCGRAQRLGGADYRLIASVAYRQTIAAHKLIADDFGELVFLSKECDSNGCIGTVDVSYPSVPLYLMYNTEFVKGMMRPVLHFASLPVWEYDFAPHDVGRYPYANGQVYGLTPEFWDYAKIENGDVFPPFYQYPKGSGIYYHKDQMPVEECGNMLIMAAAVTRIDGNALFAGEYMDIFEKWVCYLLEYGQDPGEQLCTDDFAGHLAHNINLSAKAIMGVAAYSIILGALGRSAEAEAYMSRARGMAESWEAAAQADGRTALTFADKSGWSMKYNTVWDILFGTELFSPELFGREAAWYLRVQNKYGVPLDSRRDYTKSDWILWCAAFAPDAQTRQKLISPVAAFLRESPKRSPFSDWYETKTGEIVHFYNRTVQGGLFMPLLREFMEKI